MRPSFDRYQADNFFRVLFDGCNNTVELRSLPDGGPAVRGWHNWNVAGEWMEFYWNRGSDPHFGVVPRIPGKGKMETLPEFQLFYADIDTVTDDTADKLAICPPTMIVRSGRGYHCYWRLTEVQTREFMPDWLRIQSTLVSRVGGDRSGKDPTRLLRVPGTFNFKRNAPVKVVKCDIDLRYTVDDMIIAFGVSSYAIHKSRLAYEDRLFMSSQKRELSGDSPTQPPEPLLSALRGLKCRYRWVPEKEIAVLKKCPCCAYEREITGGSEDEKAWLNTDAILQCWREKCTAGPLNSPGGMPLDAWYPIAVALEWADSDQLVSVPSAP